MKVYLQVKNKQYLGWEKITINKSMMSICNNLSMSLDDSVGIDISSDDLLEVYKDDKIFFTGYLDSYEHETQSKVKPLKITARSKAMDLVDCSIYENKEYNKLTAEQIIKQMIKPFNIEVSTNLKLEPIETFSTKVGETYFNAINRLCKQVNILPISDERGNIKLIKNSNIAQSETLTDNKFLGLKIKNIFNNRFSTYTYKKESSSQDIQDGTVEDSEIKRFRPFLEVNTENKSNKDLAEWKKNNSLAKSISIDAKFESWDFDINTIHKIDTKKAKGQFLIKDIQYSKDNSGTISKVNFVDKDLFNVR